MSDRGWKVVLNGVVLAGYDDDTASGFLTKPPDGLGLPPLRTNDLEISQVDGVAMYNDWYANRIVTLDKVSVSQPPGCLSSYTDGFGYGDGPYGGTPPLYGGGDPGSATTTTRRRVRDISNAWARDCGETELVIFTPDHGTDDRSLVGPFGCVGRARVAETTWLPGEASIAEMLLRFDSIDHRLYVLDADGTPGSGWLEREVVGANGFQTQPNIVTASETCTNPIITLKNFRSGPGGAPTDYLSSIYIYLNPVNGDSDSIAIRNRDGLLVPGALEIEIDTATGRARQRTTSFTRPWRDVTYALQSNVNIDLHPGANRFTTYTLDHFNNVGDVLVDITVEWREAVKAA